MASIESETAYAVTVDSPSQSRRGGEVRVPDVGAAVDLFSIGVDQLTAPERAQPGWCLTFSVSDVPPLGAGALYALQGLIAEVTFTTGGIQQETEIDVFPSARFHVAAERVGARLRWLEGGSPAPASVRWHVTRGICPTTATRTIVIPMNTAPTVPVPLFATHWALFTNSDMLAPERLSESPVLAFRGANNGAGHTYDTDELLAAIGGPPLRLPPGARVLDWLQEVADVEFRLAFYFGGVQ